MRVNNYIFVPIRCSFASTLPSLSCASCSGNCAPVVARQPGDFLQKKCNCQVLSEQHAGENVEKWMNMGETLWTWVKQMQNLDELARSVLRPSPCWSMLAHKIEQNMLSNVIFVQYIPHLKKQYKPISQAISSIISPQQIRIFLGHFSLKSSPVSWTKPCTGTCRIMVGSSYAGHGGFLSHRATPIQVLRLL